MDNKLMWGYMLHLGYNFWLEHTETPFEYGDFTSCAEDYLRCDKPTWDELTLFMAKSGVNMLLIDLGEGVKYQSHPELAVKGSWSVDFLKNELSRLRKMGITPIPKLNFSTGHDEWLREYSRQVSTAKYYDVCKDLIEEVIDIFDKPELFHLGMDEETLENQKYYAYSTVRNGDLWWHDLYKNLDILEKNNVRAWVWSDYIWANEKTFLNKMPKTVMQSNWYYDTHYNMDEDPYIKAYSLLNENGYDQIPTGSNWLKSDNFNLTVKYCKDKISKEHLKGFLQTPWKMTMPEFKYLHMDGINSIRLAMEKYFNK